ncbi:MAG: hypothetical protein PHT00_00345 [Candidatus Methanomethylophilus sp.]|nr:hypothetical protein [Methanomethylophilus sp.]MDD4222254.1 hypothetical protein [Methanomethylophilus sp.]
MSNYRIKLERADEKLDTSVKTVELGSKKFTTPYKSLSSSGPGGVTEIFFSFDADKLNKGYDGKSNLDKLPGMCKKDSINLIMPSYADRTITDRNLSLMENRIHPCTDAVIIPRWDGALSYNSESSLAEDLWGLTERYIEEVRRINGKLIIGNIPLNKSQSVVDLLLKNYLDKGITSFVLDYGRCQVQTKAHLSRSIIKKLDDHTSDKNYLMYSMNMKKSHDYNEIKPADDFLTFTDGFDIMGNFHLSAGGNAGMAKQFSRKDWTYVEVGLNGENYNVFKSNNEKGMNSEAKAVQQAIIDSGTAIKLIKSKRGAEEYIRGYSQTNLDMCGLTWN